MKNALSAHLASAVREFIAEANASPLHHDYDAIMATLCTVFSELEMQDMGFSQFIAPYFQTKREHLSAQIVPAIHAAIRSHHYYPDSRPDGTYDYEMYAGPDDRFYHETIERLIRSDDPWLALDETLDDYYSEEIFQEQDWIVQAVLSELEDADLEPNLEEMIRTHVQDIFFCNPPREHYLNQEVLVNIEMDTGTGFRGFYEFRREDGELDDYSGILWLAKQQGYSEAAFRDYLKGNLASESAFLRSAKQELESTTYDDNKLCFLVKLTLRDLLGLAAAMKLQDRNGTHYNVMLIPDCGSITLDKKTDCGLYNPWNGTGGPISLELERDVEIPIRFIDRLVVQHSAHQIGGPYLMLSSFGMCTSCWKPSLKHTRKITVPET